MSAVRNEECVKETSENVTPSSNGVASRKLTQKQKNIHKLLFKLIGQLTDASNADQNEDPFCQLKFVKTGFNRNKDVLCLCGKDAGSIHWIFRHPRCNIKINICRKCVFAIRDVVGPDTAQLIELTLRVHLHGASVVYEGQDSAQLKFKIQIRKALWVQNLVKHQVGPRMDVSSNGSIVILYVGIKSGKEHG